MRCLSLWNPWALLFANGTKRVETRGYNLRHRGPMLVHAAKHWCRELNDLCNTEPFWTALGGDFVGDRKFEETPVRWEKILPFGCLLGTVSVIDCYPTSAIQLGRERRLDGFIVKGERLEISEKERAFGDFSPGRFAILCEPLVLFKTPVPYRGQQCLFEVPDAVVEDACKGGTL